MNLLDLLDPSNRTLKRAQYEALTFALLDGDVLVRNESYADPENHEYLVRVRGGIPVDCECPANAKYPGACKHRTAVALRTVVLQAAMTMQTVADGGTVPEQPVEESEPEELDEDVDCDCPDPDDPDSFPCWECVRTGRRELPQ